MARLEAFLMAFFISAIVSNRIVVDASIAKSMYVDWGNGQSSIVDSDDLQLVLDQTSGSGAASKRTFLFGSFEMLIKLVPGNSAGTVTAYYLSSDGSKHDEIDFEFLGNISGQPYIVHTNIYTLGNDSREQQFYVWFDPTADYQNYTIFWNPTEIVWYIDSIPIRVFRNYQNNGIPYPNEQGMKAYASIWDGDSWATEGGRIKINWNYAPFIVRFRQFRPRACYWEGTASIDQCATKSAANWWTSPIYNQLNSSQMGQMKWVRDNYMVYDYCKDTQRFYGQMPPECYLNESY